MVSNASDDLPEPDRPVNTTSLSRGISTSTFLRFFSRAARIVIARRVEPVCWLFALITSSISVFPSARGVRRVEARMFRKYRIGRQRVNLEHGKNARKFPVPAARHQPFVGAVGLCGFARNRC